MSKMLASGRAMNLGKRLIAGTNTRLTCLQLPPLSSSQKVIRSINTRTSCQKQACNRNDSNYIPVQNQCRTLLALPYYGPRRLLIDNKYLDELKQTRNLHLASSSFAHQCQPNSNWQAYPLDRAPKWPKCSGENSYAYEKLDNNSTCNRFGHERRAWDRHQKERERISAWDLCCDEQEAECNISRYRCAENERQDMVNRPDYENNRWNRTECDRRRFSTMNKGCTEQCQRKPVNSCSHDRVCCPPRRPVQQASCCPPPSPCSPCPQCPPCPSYPPDHCNCSPIQCPRYVCKKMNCDDCQITDTLKCQHIDKLPYSGPSTQLCDPPYCPPSCCSDTSTSQCQSTTPRLCQTYSCTKNCGPASCGPVTESIWCADQHIPSGAHCVLHETVVNPCKPVLTSRDDTEKPQVSPPPVKCTPTSQVKRKRSFFGKLFTPKS